MSVSQTELLWAGKYINQGYRKRVKSCKRRPVENYQVRISGPEITEIKEKSASG